MKCNRLSYYIIKEIKEGRLKGDEDRCARNNYRCVRET